MQQRISEHCPSEDRIHIDIVTRCFPSPVAEVNAGMQLYNADCFDVFPDIPDSSVDMVFTDMPYGTTKNRWDTEVDLERLWREYERIIRENGCIALWAQSPFDKVLACSNLKLYRYEWIIEKTNATGFLNARRAPLKAHENVLIFYRKQPVYNPQMTHGYARKSSTAQQSTPSRVSSNYSGFTPNSYDSTDRFPRDVLLFSWDKQKTALHPTQKPVSACEYFVKTYTNEGDTVLDSFMGSGSIGVACRNCGRNYIGIENDTGYFMAAEKRLKKNQISV